MNILLLGSGGREHALANAIAKSPLCTELYIAPGNPGTEHVGINFDINIQNHREIVVFCRSKLINLVIVGPEVPLAEGIVDVLNHERIPVFGPTKSAAQLESSKSFCKDFCSAIGIPTADYATFDNTVQAIEYIKTQSIPIVIKNDALAAGKGVVVAETFEQAENAVIDFFGLGAEEIIVEEFLQGEEVSFFVISDGVKAIPIGTAQDHKRVGEGDTGPNTGGMGAYSPASIVTPKLTSEIMDKIINPTIDAMRELGKPYRGILYAGLMLTATGPKLIEYNVRFGDPEAQVILPRLQDDIVRLMLEATYGGLQDKPIKFSKNTALTVVMAAKNYPSTPVINTPIYGLEKVKLQRNVILTHAGTKYKDKKLVAGGGRVLNITAVGKDIVEAQKLAYDAIKLIEWEEGFYRKDIGYREVSRIKAEKPKAESATKAEPTPKAEAKPKVAKPKAEKKPKVEKVSSQESKPVSGQKRANSKTPKSVKGSS